MLLYFSKYCRTHPRFANATERKGGVAHVHHAVIDVTHTRGRLCGNAIFSITDDKMGTIISSSSKRNTAARNRSMHMREKDESTCQYTLSHNSISREAIQAEGLVAGVDEVDDCNAE